MQVIVAFILEAFVFRIQYRMVMNGQDMDGAFWIGVLHHISRDTPIKRWPIIGWLITGA